MLDLTKTKKNTQVYKYHSVPLSDTLFNIGIYWHLITLSALELDYRMKYKQDDKISVMIYMSGHVTSVGTADNTVP